jgi:hypothetical protein
MRGMVNSIADRVLGAIVPKTAAGACPCGPGDNYYEYSCSGGWHHTRYCQVNCWCQARCGAWVNDGFICP